MALKFLLSITTVLILNLSAFTQSTDLRLLTDQRAQFWIQQYHKAEFLEVYVDSLIIAIEKNQRLCDSLTIAHRGVIDVRDQEVKLLKMENSLLIQSEGISNQ